jgi:DNA modification methylase
VTSPPYYGLRAYLPEGHPDKAQECGLEDTPEAYVARLVEVFREVRRVLHDTGTLWLNLGSSYASKPFEPWGIKPKDDLLMPHRVAMALQADGWICRADIVWAKKNAMPSSVRDRPTSAHEYLFLLTKRATYYYDADAVREDYAASTKADKREFRSNRAGWSGNPNVHGEPGHPLPGNPAGRNRRSVWSLASEPFRGAHFACMPTKLIEPCILAGTSAHGHCSSCGAGWVREVERQRFGKAPSATKFDDTMQGGPLSRSRQAYRAAGLEGPPPAVTTGWRPSCSCNAPIRPGVILDPFCGSGTTLMVAAQRGRDAIGIDLNESYLDLARQRLAPWLEAQAMERAA